MQQDLSQARQLLEHFLQCYFVERDLEKTMACLTEDVYSIGTGKKAIAHKKEDFRKLLEQELRKNPAPSHYQWKELIEKQITEDVIEFLGEIEMGKPFQERQPVHLVGRITALVKQDPGENWRICSFHLSIAADTQMEESYRLPGRRLSGEYPGKTVSYPPQQEISSSQEQETLLKKQQYFISLVLSNNTIGTMITYCDLDFTFAYVGDNLIHFLGCTREEFEKSYTNALQIVYPEDRESVRKKVKEQLQMGDYYEIEYRLQKWNSNVIWVLERGSKRRDEDGKEVLVCSFLDVSQHKKRQRQLVLETKVDPLTCVFNRRGAREEISRKLNRDCTMGCSALLLLDLDNFKQINDCYGHIEGDHVLCEIAQLLRGNFRKDDVISRLGGDEFSVFVSGMRSVHEVKKRALSICKTIKEHFSQKGKKVTVSIGIAPVTVGQCGFDTLYLAADKALYCAKEKGKNTACILEGH